MRLRLSLVALHRHAKLRTQWVSRLTRDLEAGNDPSYLDHDDDDFAGALLATVS